MKTNAELQRECDAEEEDDVLVLASESGGTTRDALAAHYHCDPEFFDFAINRLMVDGRLVRHVDGTLHRPA